MFEDRSNDQMGFPDAEEESRLKLAFAFQLCRTAGDATKAAGILFPGDHRSAAVALARWPQDAEVRDEVDRLKMEYGDEIAYLTKAELVQMTVKVIETSRDAKDKFAGLRLIADLQGMIEKPGTQVNINNVIAPKVMAYRDAGTDEEWGAKLLEQQTNLKKLAAVDVEPASAH